MSASNRPRFGVGALLFAAIVSAAIGGGAAWTLTGSHSDHASAQTEKPAEPAELWQCPMHPTVIQDHPGDCPICGMRLVKVSKDANAAAAPSVNGLATVDIDAQHQQLIGLTTFAAQRGSVAGAWRTVGRVAVDETRVRHVNVKFSGFVERVFVDYVGRAVKKGEPLFTIYSPELLVAQEEYLVALRTRRALSAGNAQGEELVSSAKRKLSLWDIPASEIAKLESSGEPRRALTLYSPISGVVVKKDIVEGMKLDAGAMPYEVVDLSEVWVLADVYESELRFVTPGMPASLVLKAFPNRTFTGKVEFIDPLLNPETRTVKVRIRFKNASGELRPELFGEVTLKGEAREALRIPADAVIDSGTRKVVFVSLGNGKFQPREVKLGDGDGNFVEVLDGLSEGDQVVTRANFLIDSESRLKSSLSSLTAPPRDDKARTPTHEHAGH